MELTLIFDILKDADGTPARGSLSISNPAFIAADQTAVAAGTLKVSISELPGHQGEVNASLAPTEGSVKNDPAGGEARYSVTYSLKNGARYPETWAVPRTGGPKTIAQVRGF